MWPNTSPYITQLRTPACYGIYELISVSLRLTRLWDTPQTQGKPHILQNWHFFCIPLKFDQGIQTHCTCDTSHNWRHNKVVGRAEMMMLWLRSDHKLSHMSSNVQSSTQHRQCNGALFSRVQHDGLVKDWWDTRKEILWLRIDINWLHRAIQKIIDVL